MHAVMKGRRSVSAQTDTAEAKPSSQFSWWLGFMPTSSSGPNEWLPEEEGQPRPRCLLVKQKKKKKKKNLQVFSTRKALCSCRRKKNKINSLKSVSNGSSSSVEAATHVALHMYFWSPERTEEWRQTTRERLGTSFMFDAHGCAELEDDVGEETVN